MKKWCIFMAFVISINLIGCSNTKNNDNKDTEDEHTETVEYVNNESNETNVEKETLGSDENNINEENSNEGTETNTDFIIDYSGLNEINAEKNINGLGSNYTQADNTVTEFFTYTNWPDNLILSRYKNTDNKTNNTIIKESLDNDLKNAFSKVDTRDISESKINSTVIDDTIKIVINSYKPATENSYEYNLNLGFDTKGNKVVIDRVDINDFALKDFQKVYIEDSLNIKWNTLDLYSINADKIGRITLYGYINNEEFTCYINLFDEDYTKQEIEWQKLNNSVYTIMYNTFAKVYLYDIETIDELGYRTRLYIETNDFDRDSGLNLDIIAGLTQNPKTKETIFKTTDLKPNARYMVYSNNVVYDWDSSSLINYLSIDSKITQDEGSNIYGFFDRHALTEIYTKEVKTIDYGEPSEPVVGELYNLDKEDTHEH